MTNYKELADYLDGLAYDLKILTCPESQDQSMVYKAVAILRSLDAQRPTVDEVMTLADEYGTFCMNSGLAAANYKETQSLQEEGLATLKFAELRIAIEAIAAKPLYRFPKTYCSQCGAELGPGDAGVSCCCDHGACRIKAIGEVCECYRSHNAPIKEQQA